jgi:uncharacterized membrane protein YdjX (TVP38/TMEM64 family)
MKASKVLLVAALAALIAAFFALGGHRYLTFDQIKGQQAEIEVYYQAHPWQTVAGFFAVYVAVTGPSPARSSACWGER